MSDKHLPSTQHILGPDFSNEVEILTLVSSFSWNRPIIVLVYTANDYLKFNIKHNLPMEVRGILSSLRYSGLYFS